ncbi:hypothetical protein KPH14_007961 [Odynerus spinipes]|uniref:Uncharacterized protein n=1 Tax=Odynerus spinipes TaxID=1348599 RepID=A0AAD9RJZ8_9HYME|nr:hypothetical protein KPH14_007961 [Odynerus spinipes]
MGQAWCKEKTSKAQDSKSPLDRVFVRCAHRIYPGLKEEGSVLGGATQRVTSSEIGYAGSPPRDVLARGRSIDSVDRPFQPSDWVDVNLEVPSTPRASSVLTNLTIDTNLYPPTTTPTSIRSNNTRDITPVPPPRRKKRNRGRPLPPKPDEIPEKTSCNLRHVDTGDEPLYSSVLSNSPKTLVDDYATMDDVVGGCREQQQQPPQQQQDTSALSNSTTTVTTNGTRETRNEYSKGGMPEGRRTKEIYEHKVNGTGRIISSEVVSKKKASYNGGKNLKISNQHRKVEEIEDYERFANGRSIKDSSTPNRQDDDARVPRSKETPVSRQIDDSTRDNGKLEVNARPKNYSTVSLPNYDELDVGRHATQRTKGEGSEEEKIRSRRPVRSSTGSLPVEPFLLPFSEKTTTVRLEDYIPRRGSTENLSAYQEVLGKLDCTTANGVDQGEFLKYDPSKLEDWDLGDIGNCELNHRQRPLEVTRMPEIKIDSREVSIDSRDEVDFRQTDTSDRRTESPRSTNELQKPVSFGKTIESVRDDSKLSSSLDDPLREEDRYPEEATKPEISKPDQPPTCRQPFFLNQNNPFYSDTIGGGRSCGRDEDDFDRSNPRRMIFGRTLSNESEPCDPLDVSCETKELRPSVTESSKIIRTISEESLPREMMDNEKEFFDEDRSPNLDKTKTPPPSPESKIKPEILDNEHSTLLKVLKEEAAEGSNFSSMTPSLTELEVALSDMLEKEQTDQQDITKEEHDQDSSNRSLSPGEPIEPKIVPVEKSEHPMSLGEILQPKKSPINQRKVSFCTWEEKTAFNEEEILKDYETSVEKSSAPRRRSLDDSIVEKSEDIPTPPRRRHRPSYPPGILREDHRTAMNCADSEHDDRLI